MELAYWQTLEAPAQAASHVAGSTRAWQSEKVASEVVPQCTPTCAKVAGIATRSVKSGNNIILKADGEAWRFQDVLSATLRNSDPPFIGHSHLILFLKTVILSS